MTTKFAPEAPANCPLCPRLVAYREEVAVKEPDWFNGAVPSFGPEDAELLIIGLAPGVTGANRTGRPFTGDWAGDLLYATIDKFGFSTGTYDARPDDGLKLKRAMITNAVRCVPPQNKPVGAEINQCRPFLAARIAALPKLKAMICLGKISHDSTVRTLGLKLKDYPFGHGIRRPPARADLVLSLQPVQHEHPPPDAGNVRGCVRDGEESDRFRLRGLQ